MLQTKNCIKCGKPTVFVSGRVMTMHNGIRGIMYPEPILAGWCSDECFNSIESTDHGCFGDYDPDKHGEIEQIEV